MGRNGNEWEGIETPIHASSVPVKYVIYIMI